MRLSLTDYDAVDAPQMPISERLLDKLSDILLASDEILDMIATNPLLPTDTTRSVEEQIKGVYDQVNELMKSMCD